MFKSQLYCVSYVPVESALTLSDPVNEWCSQSSVLTALLSSCRLMLVASFMSESISYLIFLFSCCCYFFPALLSFPKNPAFSWYAWGRTASVLSFLSVVTFQAELAPGPIIFLVIVIQGIHKALFWHYFKWINFFPITFFLSNFHIHV